MSSMNLEKMGDVYHNSPLSRRLTEEQVEAVREVAQWCEEHQRWPSWVGFFSEWERLWPDSPVPGHNTIKRMIRRILSETGGGDWA